LGVGLSEHNDELFCDRLFCWRLFCPGLFCESYFDGSQWIALLYTSFA